MKVKLRPIINKINLPTVLKTAILPGQTNEKLFIATQVGEIFCISSDNVKLFLDITSEVIKLGSNGGYDERGLIGLAFHPRFNYNGLFYLHYSVAGTQGEGALAGSFIPDPCDLKTINLKWTGRETKYDHIDTVEEWILKSDGKIQKRRTLLNIRRPFFNHNGVNSLNFSPENGMLILTTGDGGSGYDPFNLSQDDMEIAGKIIEIDINKNIFNGNVPVVTRFNELPVSIRETLTVIAKGVRNIPGISFQKVNNQYIKYIGNVGQDLVESIFSFENYKPIRVTQLVQNSLSNSNQEATINFGWRGWEGVLPTSMIKKCTKDSALSEKIMTYYDETIKTSVSYLKPLISYFHEDEGPDKINGTALTGVQPYMGTKIPELSGKIFFIDLSNKNFKPSRGALAYINIKTDSNLSDFNLVDVDYDFRGNPSYYVCLGTNIHQTKLYLGVYESMRVTDLNLGSVFEIIF